MYIWLGLYARDITKQKELYEKIKKNKTGK